MKNLILLFLIVPIYSYAQNGEKNFIDQNYIEVTGQMETELIPDEIYISIALNEKDKRGKESIEEQEIQLIRGLKSIGIDTDKYVSIQNFYGAYTNLFLKKDEVFKSKHFELLVTNSLQLTKVFQLFDALQISNAGINRVDHSEIEKYKRESKIKALKIAKKKAEDYAHAIDQKIGKALFIKELHINQRANTNVLNESIVIRGLSSTYSQNDKLLDNISFKKIKITASILAKFELV